MLMRNGLLVMAFAVGVTLTSGAVAGAPQYPNPGKGTLPFSQAVRVDDLLYLSGQLGVEPGTLKLAPGGVEAETRQALINLRTTLEANGLTLRDVFKCTVMLTDIAEWGAFNEVYKTYFSTPYPARTVFGTSGLVLGAHVEIECIAAFHD